MGEGSLAHLASAATVAASALRMEVADPRPLLASIDQDRYRQILGERKQRGTPEVRVVEPEVRAFGGAQAGGAKQERAADRARVDTVRARIQRFGDNVDTDAIIPGEFCHLTTLPELGAKCFHYVRPGFVERAREGATVIVAGKGWGSGSSREQAVLALKGAGIQAIVAQSYAFIHKRNLVNEALPFLVVDDPAFYELAAEGAEIEVDLARGRIVLGGRTFTAAEPSRIIQALASAGGIVPAIQRHGTEVFDKLTA
jgi:aconitate hydratase/homoaconitate hydratase